MAAAFLRADDPNIKNPEIRLPVSGFLFGYCFSDDLCMQGSSENLYLGVLGLTHQR